MMDAERKNIILIFDHLSPSDFEEFTYDLLSDLGFGNLSWRKGTGKPGASADQGRDIKADLHRRDFDRTESFETYFVQCKHFKEGVPPSKLEDAVAWAWAERPSVLVFVVSNFLSNSAKNWLEDYERNNRPPFRIKVWERKDLEGLLASNPALIKKYQLGSIDPHVGLHPAHLQYMQHPLLNTIQQLLTVLDSVESEKRDELFGMSYHAIILPRYGKPVSENEKIKDLLIDRVDYPAFRAKCLETSRYIDDGFFVRAIVSDALRWIAHLADPMDLERVMDLHQDMIDHAERKLSEATSVEQKARREHSLEFMRHKARTVRDRKKTSQELYNFICESILPRLFLESLHSKKLEMPEGFKVSEDRED